MNDKKFEKELALGLKLENSEGPNDILSLKIAVGNISQDPQHYTKINNAVKKPTGNLVKVGPTPPKLVAPTTKTEGGKVVSQSTGAVRANSVDLPATKPHQGDFKKSTDSAPKAPIDISQVKQTRTPALGDKNGIEVEKVEVDTIGHFIGKNKDIRLS